MVKEINRFLITLTSTHAIGNYTLTVHRAHETHGTKMYVQKTFIKGRSYMDHFGNTEGHTYRNIL